MSFNEILSNLKKILHWGPRGLLNYLKGRAHTKNVRARLLASSNASPPVHGITLIGEFTSFGSHAKVLRDLAMNLLDANIPFQTFDTTRDPNPILVDEVQGILTPTETFCINRFNLIVEILPSVVPRSIKILRARIAFWEFESGFLYGYPDMINERHVITMSDFNTNYLRSILPSPTETHKLLYPFRHTIPDIASIAETRQTFHIPEASFTVLFNFDFGSGFNRKNPDGALSAFAKAFAGVTTTKLVLKTKNADRHPDRVQDLLNLSIKLGISEQFMFINRNISQRDLYSLVNACDVYLSLHRGEGFGITLAEAMTMGKPVVCTNWSSTTEFCHADCTLPVPFSLVPPHKEQIDNPYFREVKEWAEPDTDDAAAALKRLYDNQALRRELGQKAARSIREQFSIDNFARSVDELFHEIGLK